MRINGFRCDACSKEHLFEAAFLMQNTGMELLPADWFIVHHGKQGEVPVMVCSLQCLADWASKQIGVSKEVVPEEHRENWW